MPRQRQAAADDAGTRALWFTPPGGEQSRRRVLARDRVVAEALAIISAGGAAALSMRTLGTRLGMVPAALYRHVTSKEQLYDLILDGVLAEVDCQAGRRAALAFRLIYDYALGFALSDRTLPGEQRGQDGARRELHAFLRSLPASRFPALAALDEYAWAGDRDQRFTASLDTLISGLQAAHHLELSFTSPGPQPRELRGPPRVVHRGVHPGHERRIGEPGCEGSEKSSSPPRQATGFRKKIASFPVRV